MTDRKLRKAAPGTVTTVQVDFKHNTFGNSADKEIARFTAAGWELVNQSVFRPVFTARRGLLTPTQAALTFRKQSAPPVLDATSPTGWSWPTTAGPMPAPAPTPAMRAVSPGGRRP